MSNPFDQFDADPAATAAPAEPAKAVNPFDQFDAPKAQSNPFDKFDAPQLSDQTEQLPEQRAQGFKQGSPEWEAAFTADQALKNRSFGTKVADTIPKIPGMIVPAIKSVGKFAAGLVTAPAHALTQAATSVAEPILNAAGATDLADAAGREALTEGAEATLAGQQVETNLRSTGHALKQWTPWADDARTDFQNRVDSLRDQMQIAASKPLDTGVVAAASKAVTGWNPADVYSPESLAAHAARPASQFYVGTASAAGDPMNLAFAAAPMMPGAKFLGGALTEATGKVLQIPGRIAEAIPGKIGRAATGTIGALEAVINPIATAKVVAGAGAAKGLQWIGHGLEEQGNAMRTGASSALDTAAATARITGSAGAPTAQRFIGDTAAHGASTAVGMLPLNVALSGGDPEKTTESTVGAAAFGGVFGAFQSSRPALTEAARPYLRSEGARNVADMMNANDPLAKKSAAFINQMPDEAKARTLEVIGALGSLPTATTAGVRTSKLYVLNGVDFKAALDKAQPGQQPDAARGWFNDGATYINGESPSNLNANGLVHTIGHEFGGHAAMNILQAMGAPGGTLYEGLMNSARAGLMLPNGKPTPAFKNFIDSYNLAFDKTGATKAINADDNEALHEFIAETAGHIIANDGIADAALPKNILDRIQNGIGNFMGKITGSDPQKIGGKTNFDREEIGSITQAVRDSLAQIAGAKLREGAELPPEAQSAVDRITELHEQLAQSKPVNPTADEARADYQNRARARQELKSLGEQPDRAAKQQQSAERKETRVAIQKLRDLYKFSSADAGEKVTKAIQAAREAGIPITSDALVKHAREGKFTDEPAPTAQPITVPENSTFKDENGTAHVVTGTTDQPARIGDMVMTRDGEIRRVTAIHGDTIDTARPIDPLTARGTKTHKAGDYQTLEHDYAPEATPAPATSEAPPQATPALRVVPLGETGRFQIIDAAGNPTSKNTFASEKDAQQSIRQQGKGSFNLPPNQTGAPDVIDTLLDRTGGIYFDGMSKEERENFIRTGNGKTDKFIRSQISSSNPANTPDEIARLVAPSEEEPQGHGDGTTETLAQLITEAYQKRQQFADQLAAEEKRQKAQPNEEPAQTEPESSTPVPERTDAPVAVATEHDDTVDTPQISEATIAALANEAELAVHATRTARHKPETLPKAITDAQVDAVAGAHADQVPLNYEGIRLRTDPLGKQTITGRINPSRPFDAFLLRLADISETAIGHLQNLQSKIGQTVTINYQHAPHEGDAVTNESRKAAQKASSATARAAGEADAQSEDKNIIPLEVRFNKGSKSTDTPSITVLGASPEKLLNNFNLAKTEVERLGGEVPYRDIHDPHLVADMKGVARNHRNGWKGDGSAPIKAIQDVRVPTADKDFKPFKIDEDRFNFLNLILGDESAKVNKRGTPESKLKQALAVTNDIPMTGEGETNALRMAINGANEGLKDADAKPTTWTKQNIENPLSEAIRVDLINEIKHEVSNEDASLRPHGYTGDIGRFFSEGSPNRTFSASGFLPDTAGAENASDKVKERAAKLWKEKGTESPFFRKWFGQSAAVDKEGNPLHLFHGTNDTFSEFTHNHPNRKDTGWLGQGFYFSESPRVASDYTMLKAGASPQIMKVFLKIEKPYQAHWNEKERIMLAERRNPDAARQRTQQLISEGYDGIIQEVPGGAAEYVVFHPDQIKSATANTTFDPTNPDIRFLPESAGESNSTAPVKKQIDDALMMTGNDPIKAKAFLSKYLEKATPEVAANLQAAITELDKRIGGKKFMPELAEVPTYQELFSDDEKRPREGFTYVDPNGRMRRWMHDGQLTTQDGVQYMPDELPPIGRKQVEDMAQRLWNSDLRDYYDPKDLVDPKTWRQWLEQSDAHEIALALDSHSEFYDKYLSKLPEEFTAYDMMQAYKDGKLPADQVPGNNQPTAPLNLTETEFSPTGNIGEPAKKQQLSTELLKKIWNTAQERSGSKNKLAIMEARKAILIQSHQQDIIEGLGITSKDLNKALRAWSNFPADARNQLERFNRDVPEVSKWSGILNSAFLSRATINPKDVDAMVKHVEAPDKAWNTPDAESYRRYIIRTMLAIDTRIDYRDLSFIVDAALQPNGQYQSGSRTIIMRANSDKTVAHEIGHYLDHKWGREIGIDTLLSDSKPNFSYLKTSPERVQWANRFQEFVQQLSDRSDIASEYTQSRREVFARFIDHFVSWTSKTAGAREWERENRRDDKFNASDDHKFVRLLQEKAFVDATDGAHIKTMESERNRTSTKGETVEGVSLPENQSQPPRAATTQDRAKERLAFKDPVASTALKDLDTGEIWHGEPLHGLLHDKIPNMKQRRMEAGFITKSGQYLTQDQTEKKTGMSSGEELFTMTPKERKEWQDFKEYQKQFRDTKADNSRPVAVIAAQQRQRERALAHP